MMPSYCQNTAFVNIHRTSEYKIIYEYGIDPGSNNYGFNWSLRKQTLYIMYVTQDTSDSKVDVFYVSIYVFFKPSE